MFYKLASVSFVDEPRSAKPACVFSYSFFVRVQGRNNVLKSDAIAPSYQEQDFYTMVVGDSF
jgi:hypothetical protein